jgi:PAS domain S-box-containing protein
VRSVANVTRGWTAGNLADLLDFPQHSVSPHTRQRRNSLFHAASALAAPLLDRGAMHGSGTWVSPTSDVILEHIADALVLLDRDGRIVYTNERFSEMVGRHGQDLRGLRWADLADAETSARLDPVINPSLSEAQIHFNIDLALPGGASGTYCLSASQVHGRDGRAPGVLQNFRSMDRLRDMILGLKDVNEAIQREKDRIDQVLDSIADGIFTVDPDLVIRSFSGRIERLTGIRAGDAQGRRCGDVFHGSKCASDCPLRWTLANGATVERCHEQFQLPDGRVVPVTVTTAFLQDARGRTTGLTGIVRDESEIEHLRRELHERHSRHNLIGRSGAMRELMAAVEALSSNDATVLITGETGTGKELVARAIHHDSSRRDRPFVSVNCAALNDNLLESELFGHVRGAFTGAVHDTPGRFEAAAGGTILLDEIGDTTPAFQAKLLRVLQEKTFERVGDYRSRRTDVRVIAATNRDLRRLVQEGRFREDLYYRLAVVPVHVPPLRDRREDIPLLVEHLIQKYRPRYFAGHEDRFEGISNRALAVLIAYAWPGNVRELEHAIEYAMISTTTNRIERAFLPAPMRPPELAPASPAVEAAGPETDADRLRRALEMHRWSGSRTAQALGISRTTLWRRMKRFGLLEHP